ncbi:MAG: hypothetical protein ACJ71K_05285 [Nitrososphaeraceae archaeon]
MNSLGIIIFFTIALATASVTSLTVEGPQQAMAKSSNSVMKSLIANTTRIGVLSMPITCNSLGDIMGAVSGVIANATAGGGNQTNSTQGMSGVMGALSGMLGNATTTAAAGGNQTSSMQEMMTSGMQNMSQGKLQHLNNLMFCSPANEKMIRSMMK